MELRDRDLQIDAVAKSNAARFLRRARQADKDDLLQEARIGAWRAMQVLDATRPESEQRAYVGRAAHSRALNFIRWMSRHQGRELASNSGAENLIGLPTEESPEVTRDQARKVLTTAMELAQKRKQRGNVVSLRRMLARAGEDADRFRQRPDPQLQGLIVEAAEQTGLQGLIRRCL